MELEAADTRCAALSRSYIIKSLVFQQWTIISNIVLLSLFKYKNSRSLKSGFKGPLTRSSRMRTTVWSWQFVLKYVLQVKGDRVTWLFDATRVARHWFLCPRPRSAVNMHTSSGRIYSLNLESSNTPLKNCRSFSWRSNKRKWHKPWISQRDTWTLHLFLSFIAYLYYIPLI